MTLEDLIDQFRTDAQDKAKPYLSSDEEVTLWLNEAEEEAALRKRLLFESTDPALCSIPVAAGVMVYDLHEAWFQITRATFTATGATDPVELFITNRQRQDQDHCGWRTKTDEPREVIIDDTKVQLGCLPASAGTLALEGYRAPLEPMAKDDDTPEIGRAHHRFLGQWAIFKHYSKPDAEIQDATRADKAEKAFIAYFGERPDADLRRDHEANRPAHNAGYF